MNDGFEEQGRKAAGLPPNAERQAKAAEHATLEWERNAPIRQEALDMYEIEVKPLIDEYLKRANKVASEAQPAYCITESPSSETPPTILLWRSFQLLKATQPTPTRSTNFHQPAPGDLNSDGTLHVTLQHTGELFLEVLTSQKIQTSSTKGIPIKQIDRTEIEAAFLKLLGRLKSSAI